MNGDYVKDTLEGRHRSDVSPRRIAAQPFGVAEENRNVISCASPFVSSSYRSMPFRVFFRSNE